MGATSIRSSCVGGSLIVGMIKWMINAHSIHDRMPLQQRAGRTPGVARASGQKCGDARRRVGDGGGGLAGADGGQQQAPVGQ